MPATSPSSAFQVALSLAVFLRSARRRRLKLCANPGCGFVFVDTSINATRRWCYMRYCGDRLKVRAFRRRQAPGRNTTTENDDAQPRAHASPGAERGRYCRCYTWRMTSIAQVHGYCQFGHLSPRTTTWALRFQWCSYRTGADGVVELKSVAWLLAASDTAWVANYSSRYSTSFVCAVRGASLSAQQLQGRRSGLLSTRRIPRVEGRAHFFCPARGYPPRLEEDGIPVRDMLWLDQDLRESVSARSERRTEFG